MPDIANQSNVRPTIISSAMIARALMDPKFFQQLPEFLPIQMKLVASKEPQIKGGCGSCRQRRMVVNSFQDFMHTIASLSPDALVRLKLYFAVPSIMLHSRDASGRPQLKVI